MKLKHLCPNPGASPVRAASQKVDFHVVYCIINLNKIPDCAQNKGAKLSLLETLTD